MPSLGVPPTNGTPVGSPIPVPLLSQVAVELVAVGPQKKKWTLGGEVGSGAGVTPVPVIVARSWTGVPGETDVWSVTPALAFVLILALHCWKLPSTKSFRVALVDCEERVSARKVEKHSPAIPRLVASMPPSYSSPGWKMLAALFLGANGHGEGLAALFTSAQKSSASAGVQVAGFAVPPARSSRPLAVQKKTRTVGVPPPWVKSLRIRMSPWVRTLPPASNVQAVCAPGPNVPLASGATFLRKNQKPICESPLLASRSAPKYRY